MLTLGIWLLSFLVPSILAVMATPIVRSVAGAVDPHAIEENVLRFAGFTLPLVLIAGSVWGIRLLGGRAADLGWRRAPSPWRSVVLGVLAGAGAWIVFLGVGALLELLVSDLDTLAPYRDSFEEPSLLASLFVSAVVLAPIGEELYWRGFVLSWLAGSADRCVRAGRSRPTRLRTLWVPIAVTAVLWSATHFNAASLLQLVIFGLLLGWLRTRDAGSLTMPIAAHATNNALTMVAVLLAGSAS